MKSKTEFLNKINKNRDKTYKILEDIEFFDDNWEDKMEFISTPTVEYSEKESNDNYHIIKWMIDKGYLGQQISQNNCQLKELMELIEKHVIALRNNMRIQGDKITMVKDKKSAGLDEAAYKRMFELYEELKSNND